MSSNVPAGLDTPVDYTRAYEKMQPQFALIADKDCLTINTDIPFAANTALWAAKKIKPLRAACVQQLPLFAINLFDDLEHVAGAAAQAHANFTLASDTSSINKTISELDEKLNVRRTQFLADINALASRGLIDNSKLDELKNPNGYKNLSTSVLALAALLRTNWASIQNRTGVTQEELADAQDLAERMNAALTLRERGPEALVPATLARKQAFTLLMKTYDRVLSAVTFVRWDARDAEEYMPSLFLNQPRRASASDRSQPAAPNAPNAPVGPVTPVAEPIALAVNPAPARPEPGEGLPGSDPLG